MSKEQLSASTGEFQLPMPQDNKGEARTELPPKDVVDYNLDNYPEAHRAEVAEAFKQAEHEEKTAQESEAA